VSASDVVAALGPTNTGKTHRALERLLDFESAMIGLPLRLLAREVYDRLTAQVGEARVALVTGEEKRVPRRPSFWVCTVEAMPVDRPVDFLCVDEIQLAGHRERGHVFTDRLLHARGRRETWFLGADTIAPLLRQLVPEVRILRRPRLSTLRHTGKSGLGGLPPRSAAVAFSSDDVYQLAARLRAKKGGAAVVLGALSPRTRNAQVALYQAREVQYLVATDAIGMGLNLDLDHVAFAAGRKFDGRVHRPLETQELAQIAGRAGRHRRDGTFGTLNPLPPLPPHAVRDIEEHRFPALRRLVWRNADLDFRSVDALLASLADPPPDPRLVRVERADDFDALRTLSQREAVRARATDPPAVGLLWEVCQVPDFRKLLLLRHVRLLEALFLQLVEGGPLDEDFLARQVDRIDRTDGEIDQLMARLAAVRVWTYVTHRSGWVADPGHWQARTRALEDALGDALHERLVERFVPTGRRRTVALAEVPAAGDSPFAALVPLLEEARAPEPRAELADAPHEAFGVDGRGRITAEGRPVGRLLPGRELASPTVRVDLEVGAGERRRLERRLTAFVRDWVEELLRPLRAAEGLEEPAVRGLLYQLARGLGTVSRRDAGPQLEALDDAGRAHLRGHGVVLGTRSVFSRPLLDGAALRRRALLARLAHPELPRPKPGQPSLPRARGVTFEGFLALGFVPVGAHAVRADLLERAARRLRKARGHPLPDEVRSWLGVADGELPALLGKLGVRVAEDGTVRSRRRR
jgi:ATP-dependent RNA helicase SUPV3L1/SUV3